MTADHKMPNCENEARQQYRCAFWIHASPDRSLAPDQPSPGREAGDQNERERAAQILH